MGVGVRRALAALVQVRIADVARDVADGVVGVGAVVVEAVRGAGGVGPGEAVEGAVLQANYTNCRRADSS